MINPEGDLPFGASCSLEWPAPSETETLSFSVLASLPSAVVPYDRGDPSRYAPFPDDVWLVPDAGTPTGARVELPVPDREPDVRFLFGRLNMTAGSPDGFSPLGALVVELSEAPAEGSLPATPAESLDPFATVGLFDIDPDSPGYRKRVPLPAPRSVGSHGVNAISTRACHLPLDPVRAGGKVRAGGHEASSWRRGATLRSVFVHGGRAR